MLNLARLRRRYRRFRLYHTYSQPVYLTLLDFALFAGKILGILLVLSIAYSGLGRALKPASDPETIVADTVVSNTVNVVGSETSQNSESVSNTNREVLAQTTQSDSKSGDERSAADSDTTGTDSDTADADDNEVTAGAEVSGPVVSPQSADIAVPGQLVFDESWIFQQDLGSYTVQFGSSAGLPQLTEFAAEFSSEPMIVLYKFKKAAGDGSEFGIAGGLYNSVPEALVAIDQLTAEQRRYSPWIRSIADLRRLVVSPRAE